MDRKGLKIDREKLDPEAVSPNSSRPKYYGPGPKMNHPWRKALYSNAGKSPVRKGI